MRKIKNIIFLLYAGACYSSSQEQAEMVESRTDKLPIRPRQLDVAILQEAWNLFHQKEGKSPKEIQAYLEYLQGLKTPVDRYSSLPANLLWVFDEK